MSDTRLILAVQVESLPQELLETGFHPLTDSNVLTVLEDAEAWFGPREVLETFDAYRQVIPYVIAVYDGKIVSYTRTPKGGESRLHGKVSFGLGGHVDLPDAAHNAEGFDMEATLLNAARRELAEEINYPWDHDYVVNQVGLLTENATAVDRVHIGVVSVVRLETVPAAAEDEIGPIKLLSIEELMLLNNHTDYELENWSKILLPHLSDLIRAETLYGLTS